MPPGRAGWGIAWFIDGTLIPELVVERGQTYTFIVFGGDDPNNLAQYHPLYITNSPNGGRSLNTAEQQAVRYHLLNVHVYVVVLMCNLNLLLTERRSVCWLGKWRTNWRCSCALCIHTYNKATMYMYM